MNRIKDSIIVALVVLSGLLFLDKAEPSVMEGDAPRIETVETINEPTVDTMTEPIAEVHTEPEYQEPEQTEMEYMQERYLHEKRTALANRIGTSDLQFELIQGYLQNTNWSGYTQEEAYAEFKISMTSSGILTAEQADGYFEYMDDLEATQELEVVTRKQEFGEMVVSDIQLALGLPDDRLDEVYETFYEEPEDIMAALATVLSEDELQRFLAYYE
jgi:hypothetical protein